mmetsp:Transcript_4665/g.7005  ORF Transcript_4665/g.7005 Transcript_4665/m.7005 type:complete len:509 (+) Transcript_4665:442-1968(+)|eukprot:CAMPEP_0203744514 /NCGR_PEP_ID=MMETSP0098-20131031/555_1 /ASSEMBLY_ACC=CAM_ASM_000208 /TAXON_ID=96639 /ORGANISM=" , Strain NY0313808BC1" /LENGTH=508 /DNA_ID=CAMNT_0050632051 /DNA_START=2575 /DNA_END=4101 /DNA_ORIENTATION=-
MSGFIRDALVKVGLVNELDEKRILLLGNDGSGRTTALYKLVLGELVQTIPTIGFNVEHVRSQNKKYTIWDLGGCDKLRPLFKHYFPGTDALIFFIDMGDPERLDCAIEYIQYHDDTGPQDGLDEDVTRVILLNKMDDAKLGIAQVKARLAKQAPLWTVVESPKSRGDGLSIALPMISELIDSKANTAGSKPSVAPTRHAKDRDPLESKFEEWLRVVDEPDEVFIKKLLAYDLDNWDHRTHLRLAWIHLRMYGRRRGMELIFERIEKYIANSKNTSGKTFHQTMTYFWVHMVHLALVQTKSKDQDFRTFLVLNPQLANGGLFLSYYSKALMFDSLESRARVVLPDQKPLPSMITDLSKVGPASFPTTKQRSYDQCADDEFVTAVEQCTWPSWNHECLIRVIYRILVTDGRDIDAVLSFLAKKEGEHFHLTVNYFWVQLVHFVMSLNGVDTSNITNAPSFREFRSLNGYKEYLSDANAIIKYYKAGTVFSEQAKQNMTLPDLKPLPNIIR